MNTDQTLATLLSDLIADARSEDWSAKVLIDIYMQDIIDACHPDGTVTEG